MSKVLRKLYNWVTHFAGTPYGLWALFLIAFSEASFFPIPPDALLIPLCVSIPKRSFWFAFICSVASVLGGIFGYFIGFGFYEAIGRKIIELYGFQDYFGIVGRKYEENAFIAILIAGFTPIPYKVFTIAAGVFHEKISLYTLVIASIISRSARFFLVATLLYIFGERVRDFIEKYLNILTLIFVLLLILGFLIIKYLI